MIVNYNSQVAQAITETGKVTLAEIIARLKEHGVVF